MIQLHHLVTPSRTFRWPVPQLFRVHVILWIHTRNQLTGSVRSAKNRFLNARQSGDESKTLTIQLESRGHIRRCRVSYRKNKENNILNWNDPLSPVLITQYLALSSIHERLNTPESVSPKHMTSSNGSIFRVPGPLCGEFADPSEFPAQRPVTRSFDVFFDLRLNKRSSKQS